MLYATTSLRNIRACGINSTAQNAQPIRYTATVDPKPSRTGAWQTTGSAASIRPLPDRHPKIRQVGTGHQGMVSERRSHHAARRPVHVEYRALTEVLLGNV